MSIGTDLGLTLPTPNVTTDWGDDLNTILQTLIDCIEQRITPAAININENLEFNDNRLTEVAGVRMEDQLATQTAGTDTSMLYQVSGELYYTDGAGVAVQITNSGTVNAAPLATNGITGSGYGVAGVSINWDSLADEYEMKNGSGADDFAAVTAAELRLRDGSGNHVELNTTGLSSDYSVTFPASLPPSTRPLTITSSGDLAYSSTLANLSSIGVTDITATGTVVAPTLNSTTATITTANITTSNTTTGNITTVNADNINLNNKSYTHADRSVYVGGSGFRPGDLTQTGANNYFIHIPSGDLRTDSGLGTIAASAYWVCNVHGLYEGSMVKQMTVYTSGGGGGSDTGEVRLYHANTLLGTASISGVLTSVTVNVTQVQASDALWLYFSPTVSNADIHISHVELIYGN